MAKGASIFRNHLYFSVSDSLVSIYRPTLLRRYTNGKSHTRKRGFQKTCMKRAAADSRTLGQIYLECAVYRRQADGLKTGWGRPIVGVAGKRSQVLLPSFFSFPCIFAVSLHPLFLSLFHNTHSSSFLFLSLSLSLPPLSFSLSYCFTSLVYRTGAPLLSWFQAPAYLILWEIHTGPLVRWERGFRLAPFNEPFSAWPFPFFPSIRQLFLQGLFLTTRFFPIPIEVSAVRLHVRTETVITRTCSRCKKRGAILPSASRTRYNDTAVIKQKKVRFLVLS